VIYILTPFGIGIVLIIIGWILWEKGDPKESLVLAIISWIVDIFTGQFASSMRTWAMLLYISGFIAIIIGLMRII